MLRMATGQSDVPDPQQAMEEALAQCMLRLEGERPSLGILYTSCMDADFERLQAHILSKYPELQLLGCTTDGEFSDAASWSEESVVLSLLCPGEGISCGVGIGQNLAGDTFSAAEEAVRMASRQLHAPPKLCLAIPDGLNTFANPVAEALGRALGPGVPLAGGTAGDGFRAVKTWQFHNGKVCSNSLPVLLFSGDFHFSLGLASGWNPIGPHLEITAAQGAVVQRINGTPALDFYKEYLGQDSLSIQELSPFSLAVYPHDSEDFYLRAPAAMDAESGAVIFAGAIPQGAQVRFTEMGREEVARAAGLSAQQALAGYRGEAPEAVLAFSCTSRRQILGSRTAEESEHLCQQFPDTPFSGFYTYGEFCPFASDTQAQFHNGTFVTCCLGRR